MIEACQWYKSSPTGPAEHDEGGSLGGVSRCTGGGKTEKKKTLASLEKSLNGKCCKHRKGCFLVLDSVICILHQAAKPKTKNGR